ncbi:MAG: tetratricopeptide repeat protein [Crocinitomicaceae bacterium]|nr:tetratricopeptide repeat protein [Crocinitomicaceae bacterium]
MKYFLSIFLLVFSIQISAAQKPDAELSTLRVQLENGGDVKFGKQMGIARKGYSLAQKEKSQNNLVFFAAALGDIFHFKSEMDSALHYHLIALKIYEKQNDFTGKGIVLNKIARVHRKLENTNKALNYYDLLLKLQVKQGNQEGIAVALNESGVVYEQMGNQQEAQSRYRRSLEIQKERKDSTGIGYALSFIGYNYLIQSKWTESEKYLLESVFYFQETKDSFALCLNYSYLGQLYSKTAQFEKSNAYILKSNKIAWNIKYADIEIENLKGLIHNTERKGNFQEALKLQRQLMTLRDSLYNIEKIKNVENINEKYQTSEKEKQLLIQESEIAAKELNIQSRNQWIAGLTLLSFLVAIIGFLIYRGQRIRIEQQQNENRLKMEVQRVEADNLLQQQRLNISRDLHDNIGSQLTFVISSVDTLKHFMGNRDEKISSRLSMVSDFVKDTIVELRDTIWAMNQHHIDIEDLKIRIANFIENATRSVPNMRFTFHDELGENWRPEYDSKTGMNIYRIIQEAVNNAVKHSKASEVVVKVSTQNQQIIFEISDNGSGFQADQNYEGKGLSSMQKRASEVEATLRLTSSENGTTIVLTLNQIPRS